MEIDNRLKEYIESNIFPSYDKNDLGHKIDHIEYVIRRSLEFAKQFDNIDINKVYVIASYHDIGHYIDKDNHELLSAKMFYEDEFMKEYFSEEDRIIIRDAIEDHRSSLEGEPRTVYGKIVSSADRNVSVDDVMRRIHAYSLKHYPEYSLDEMIERAYEHVMVKFGKGGRAKVYVEDKEFEQFKKDIIDILDDKDEFRRRYLEVNKDLL